MATSSTFRCPLCLKTVYQPKQLEPCMHNFCKLCVRLYVKSFLSTDQREQRIPCPVCKTLFPGPGSAELLEEWSEQLSSDSLLLQLIGDNDSIDKALNCEPCTVLGKHTQASSKCKECRERLCGQCSEAHMSFKGTRTHTLIDIDTPESSIYAVEQLPVCDNHVQKEVEYYCKNHDELICSKCAVLRHRICDILELESASESMLQKLSVATIRSNFQSLKTDIETANRTAQSEHDKFQDQVRKALVDVEDKRKKVNASFDRYKTKFAKATQEHLEQAKDVTSVDEKIAAGIGNSLTLLDTAIESENYIQLYLRCKGMARQIDGCRKCINDCNSMCKSTHLEYSFSTNIASLINDCSAIGTFQMSVAESHSIDNFKIGNIEIKKTNKPMVSPVGREQTEYIEGKNVPAEQCDILTANKSKPREKCKVGDWGLTIDIKQRSNVRVKTTRAVEIVLPDGSKPFFGGAAYLNDDKVVLTDVKHHRLILLDRDLKFLFELEVELRPRKVTVVNKKQVAVGFGNSKKVIIVNVGSKGMAISKCIYTNHLSKCVLGNNQRLFMASYKGNVENEWYLTCYNLQNDEETIIESIQGHKDGTHIALWNMEKRSYILHSCRNDDTIKCYADDGKEIFSYRLRGPGGMDVDRYGNIFVASLLNHKIVHVSPTGSLIKTLDIGQLCKPFEVRMNTARDNILVTQFESSEIHVVGLSYQ